MIILAQEQEKIEVFTCEELEVKYNELVDEYNTLNFGGTALLGALIATYLFLAVGLVIWLVNKKRSKSSRL